MGTYYVVNFNIYIRKIIMFEKYQGVKPAMQINLRLRLLLKLELNMEIVHFTEVRYCGTS